MSSRYHDHHGFTLIEATVAVFILLLGVLFIFGMFPAGANAVSTTRDTYAASELAREKMEYWVQQGYTTISTWNSATLQSGTLNINEQSNGVTQSWSFTFSVTHTPICSNGTLLANPTSSAPSQCPSGYSDVAEQVEGYVSWVPKGWSGLNVEYVRLDSLVIQGWQTP